MLTIITARADAERAKLIALASFLSKNYSIFELTSGAHDQGNAARCELKDAEFEAEQHGYTSTHHQLEIGAGQFDAISVVVKGGQSSTTVMDDSTQDAQLQAKEKPVARVGKKFGSRSGICVIVSDRGCQSPY